MVETHSRHTFEKEMIIAYVGINPSEKEERRQIPEQSSSCEWAKPHAFILQQGEIKARINHQNTMQEMENFLREVVELNK